MSERRRFNATERAALYLAADGRCSECGAALEPGWHADHVHPHSRGGATDVVNGQALCAPCNLKKGNTVTNLRQWQADALREFSLWTPQGDKGFLVEATPGAGKTRLAIEMAHRLLSAGGVERVIVAVPTARLEGQWAEAFAEHGISINPHWHAADGRLASDEVGCAATYAEISKSAQNFRKLTSERPTLVILDEIHHCGGEKAWGSGIRTAFETAFVRVLLSGTPFRSDNDEIPFVNYVDGVGVPDFRYGYRRGLSDGVVRAVFFPRRGGRMEWTAPSGRRREATFEDQLNDREAAHRLRTALSIGGDWLPSVLDDSQAQLAEVRQYDPTAGGIVFCEDTITARAVCEMLRARIGRDPILAITDEPDSDQRIKRFKNSTDPWIVTIRKVSEGVDIPRLRVGVYVTPWVTELFFRQVVGRLVRIRRDEDDPTAYLFIPDDERLRTMAEQIKVDRDHVLDQQEEDLLGDAPEGGTPGQETLFQSLFAPISATATDEGVIVDDDTVPPAEMAEAERVKRLDPATASMQTALVAKLLRNAGVQPTARPTAAPPPSPGPAPHERKESLRKSNNTLVARIVKAHGLDYGMVAGTLNQLVGLPVRRGTRQASEEQLERRLRLAQDWLATGRTPEA